MGVYINMEMPISCFYCPFRRKINPDDIQCLVTRDVFEETFTGTIEMRNRGSCPLVPVPPHGRLIDADALCEGRVSNDNVVICAKAAPTIIPSSEEE